MESLLLLWDRMMTASSSPDNPARLRQADGSSPPDFRGNLGVASEAQGKAQKGEVK
jgi:hypothetical protein